MRIKFFGRGTFYSQVRDRIGQNNRISECQGAVNWGLQGTRLTEYESRHPAILRMPILNHRQYGNKYDCVVAARENGLAAPASYRAGGNQPITMGGEWIIKPYYSLGGRGIEVYTGQQIPHGFYLQERIMNRRYEVRVHAWNWIDPASWVFQKRVHPDGEDQLTWNHHTGGSFITINEPTDPLHDRLRADVARLMAVFGYQFGACDFIICNAGERGARLPHYFLEWNLSPGWTLDNTRAAYIEAFRELTLLEPADFTALSLNEGMERGTMGHYQDREEIDPLIGATEQYHRERVEPAPQPVEPAHQPQASQALISQFCHNCGQGVPETWLGSRVIFCLMCGTRVRDAS